MRKIGIKIKILFLVFSVIVAIAMIQFFYTSRKLRTEMNDVIQSSIVQIATDSAKLIAAHLDSHFDFLEITALSIKNTSLDIVSIEKLINKNAIPHFVKLQFIDADGKDSVTGKTYGASYLPYHRAAKGRRYISTSKYDAETNRQLISLSIPIEKDGQHFGVLIGFLDAQNLSEMLGTYMNYETSYAYIANRSGHVISHQNYNSISATRNLNMLSNDTTYTKDAFSGLSEFFKESILNEYGYGLYKKNNHTIIASYCRIEHTDWNVYYAFDRDIIFKDISKIRDNFTWMFFIIALLGLFFAMIIARRIADPLTDLSEKFIQAANGNLNVRAVPNTKDEIGVVAQNFNVLMQKINQLTFYDPLTGLPNSNVLIRQINAPEGESENAENILLLVSIDKFTKVNEVYGMTIGDEILKTTAKRILQHTSTECSVYKGRGDEFFLIVPNISMQKAETRVQKLLAKLSDPYAIKGKHITLRFSTGMVQFRKSRIEASRLINQVTHANLLSKNDPVSSWKWYNRDTHELDKANADIEEKLFKAIENDEFYLVYQPVFTMKNYAIASAEALIRWNNQELGPVSTELFITIAEKSGYIKSIDYWVLQNVCRQLSTWKSKIKLSVNISAITFETPGFTAYVKGLLEKYDLKVSCLQIELTERVILNRTAETINKMNALNELGITFALDDFGIGYSSMNYLFKLPIETVKIDRSFINNIGKDLHSTAIVNAIIAMCQEIGLSVLAEGVETKSEATYIYDKNCTYAQGYFYDKPLPIETIEKRYINGLLTDQSARRDEVKNNETKCFKNYF